MTRESSMKAQWRNGKQMDAGDLSFSFGFAVIKCVMTQKSHFSLYLSHFPQWVETLSEATLL